MNVSRAARCVQFPCCDRVTAEPVFSHSAQHVPGDTSAYTYSHTNSNSNTHTHNSAIQCSALGESESAAHAKEAAQRERDSFARPSSASATSTSGITNSSNYIMTRCAVSSTVRISICAIQHTDAELRSRLTNNARRRFAAPHCLPLRAAIRCENAHYCRHTSLLPAIDSRYLVALR
jgi:hypothetical protein